MNYPQIANLLIQGTLVSVVILLLFRLRNQLGLGLLYACLGLFQFMQVFLSSTVYVSITNGMLVSPGSSVLFTATLFALLIIYIKEDAGETKKIIYALLLVNIVMSILLQLISYNFEDKLTYNPFHVSTNLFNNNAWVLLIGTITLFLDSLLIIVLYELISKRVRQIFLRICITMLTVVCFDTIFFSIIAFWSFDNLGVIIFSGLISKGFFTIFYSILFYIYLMNFELRGKESRNLKVIDVFQPLSYKQRFESASEDIKKAEEQIEIKNIHYQTLTEISPVGIFHTRSDGYTTFVNSRWCEISGFTKTKALGWGWFSAVHPDDKPAIKQEWDLALAQKRRSEVNYRFRLKDGSIRWVLGQAVPQYNSQNQLIGFVGTITDITEMKLFQQEQIFLRSKADESNRLKSAFLANMSHEIRTPMNGILGFADLLKNPELSGELQQKYIAIIEKSGIRMLNIINDIVSISKIESGMVEVNYTILDINEQQDYLYSFFKPESEAKNIVLSLKSSLPISHSFVKTDHDKFMSIYTNLIKNAIKYTEQGSIEFGNTIKGNFIEFYVKDTGIGVEPERMEAIFDRFVQADIEDIMARQGAGLGLSISEAYVKMLGGKIWVTSEKRKGSTFYFTIPYIKTSAAVPDTIAETPNTQTEKETRKLKILIVEDEETSILLIEAMLAKINCEILLARNGVEAIGQCKENPDLDIIFMDIRMPVMNGYEAVRQIRQLNKTVIIVAQTANALTQDIEKSIEAGCNEHLSKPIIKNELFSIMQHYFNYRHQAPTIDKNPREFENN